MYDDSVPSSVEIVEVPQWRLQQSNERKVEHTPLNEWRQRGENENTDVERMGSPSSIVEVSQWELQESERRRREQEQQRERDRVEWEKKQEEHREHSRVCRENDERERSRNGPEDLRLKVRRMHGDEVEFPPEFDTMNERERAQMASDYDVARKLANQRGTTILDVQYFTLVPLVNVHRHVPIAPHLAVNYVPPWLARGGGREGSGGQPSELSTVIGGRRGGGTVLVEQSCSLNASSIDPSVRDALAGITRKLVPMYEGKSTCKTKYVSDGKDVDLGRYNSPEVAALVIGASKVDPSVRSSVDAHRWLSEMGSAEGARRWIEKFRPEMYVAHQRGLSSNREFGEKGSGKNWHFRFETPSSSKPKCAPPAPAPSSFAYELNRYIQGLTKEIKREIE